MWKILVSEVSLDVLCVIMFLDFAFTPRGPCPSTFMLLSNSADIWRKKWQVVKKEKKGEEAALRTKHFCRPLAFSVTAATITAVKGHFVKMFGVIGMQTAESTRSLPR